MTYSRPQAYEINQDEVCFSVGFGFGFSFSFVFVLSNFDCLSFFFDSSQTKIWEVLFSTKVFFFSSSYSLNFVS